MKGPLHVIRRRRPERPASGVETAQVATEAPPQAQPIADLGSAPPPAATDEAPPVAEVPAGQEPAPTRPSFRKRGRLRRRLRYLRRVRELGFRDLGGLVFDQHRFSQVNDALVRSKLTALSVVDTELRALEHALDDRRPITELREPGISVCSRCGALHGSEARFCSSCGTPVRGPRAIAEVGEAVSLSVVENSAVTMAPSSTPPPVPTTPPPPAQPLAAAPLQQQPLAPVPEPAEPEPQPAAPASDGEQRTEVMRTLDAEDANPAPEPGPEAGREAGSAPEAEAVAQPTGESREP